jgi:hypothetical protein
MKPEYTGQQELDCVIIAVYLGGGKSRGGQVGWPSAIRNISD